MIESRRTSDVEIALLRQDVDEMKKSMARVETQDEMKLSMDRLEVQVEGLLEAWRTATGLVRFVKWAAGAVAAATVIWAFAKDHIK